MSDIRKLQGDALPTTHLARYEAASAARRRRVLEHQCPDCGAKQWEQCSTEKN